MLYLNTQESDSSDNEKPSSPADDDPWVEYVDEFGRTRVVRKSQVPKEPTPYVLGYSSYIIWWLFIYFPISHYPTFPPPRPPVEDTLPTLLSDDMRRDLERQRWEREAEEELARGPQHYDERREVRTKGVGFYRFSRDEDERTTQMNELKRLRNETETRRSAHQSVKDRRKEMMEKRAEMIKAKRRKVERKDGEEEEEEEEEGNGKGKEKEAEENQGEVNIDEKAIADMLRSIRNKIM